MRLLQLSDSGDFTFTKDLVGDDRIPSYAILSHTWSSEIDEVSFKDLTDGTAKDKAGYEKIQFCGERARQDGLQYFWIDTCCINRADYTELSRSINSMFHWYQNAAKCYVYLSDVSITTRKASNESSEVTWKSDFQESRWFKRGWTLQELLAPVTVEFFSRERQRLGNKTSLRQQIHEITGITDSALQGDHLSQFSVDERLSWIDGRQTKLEEDKAYSLLGIFDVSMPLIYGEGGERAFQRLQEEINKSSKVLDCLPSAADAPFNSYTMQHEPACLRGTRVELLQKINNWVDGQNRQCIFWLSGLAGTGKSTIARTIASEQSQRRCLGASFFFSRGGGDVGHAGMFVTSLARQLTNNIPTFRQHVCDALIGHGDITSRPLREQWRQLILRPLSKLKSNVCHSSYILVVDALDECNNEYDIRILLHLFAEVQSLESVRLRVFLTSRPEIPIRHEFYKILDEEHQDFVLHNISPSIVDHDLTILLEYNFKLIRDECSMDASWPGEEVIKSLVHASGGLFIWAATACQFVRDGKQHAAQRLDTILKSSGSESTVIAPEKHLDEIYTTVLKQTVPSEYTDKEKEESYCMLRQVLGSIAILFATLSVYSLGRLLCVPQEDLGPIVEDLHSILNIPKDKTQPLCLHHPSFRDFLLEKSRCQEICLWVEAKHAHQMLAEDCIRLMSAVMKQDMCGLKEPGKLATDVDTTRVEKYLPPELQYACLYWIPHLQQSSLQLCDNDQVHQFLQEHLLHWLEALGWMRKVSDGILAISSLEAQILAEKSPNLHAFIYDTKRFVLYHRSAIEQAPLQLYCSALVFTPENSIAKGQFKTYIPVWIQRKPKVQADWSASLQSLEGHSSWVSSVAFSPDGKKVVSGSHDRTVRLWDTVTGAALQTLEGHLDLVSTVTFSSDSKQVLSGSHDRTVRLWDAVTGAALQMLKGHLGWVNSVAFSTNSKQVVSGSSDRTVRLWDAVTGVALQTFKGHLDRVNSVAFSTNGKQVVSGSWDRTVRLWDAVTGAALQTLKGHLYLVTSVAFSTNGKHIVSGSRDTTVRLWDIATGAALQTFKGHSDRVNSVAFSTNGKHIVSGSMDTTVRLWDVVTGAALQTFKGHSYPVTLVAFLPNNKRVMSGSIDRTVWLWDTVIPELHCPREAPRKFDGYSGLFISVAFSSDSKHVVSGSSDSTVRLWDVVTGAVLRTLKGHSGCVNSVAFSPDSKHIVSGSSDRTVRLWDVAIGAVLQTLEGHSDCVTSVAFSPDGKQVVSGSHDRTVRLWDTATGAVLLEGHSDLAVLLDGLSDHVYSVAFSPNSKQVVSGSYDGRVRLWDTVTGAVLQTLKGHEYPVTSVAFSPNGKQVVSGSRDTIVRLWNVITGAALKTLRVHSLEGHSESVVSAAFSLNGKQVVSGSWDTTVRLWDTETGTILQTLKGHSDCVTSVAFSPNGKQVVSGSHDKTVRLWDAVTGAVLQTLEGHSDIFIEVAFSPDGKHIASGSSDRTVRLWDIVTGAVQILKGHLNTVSSVAFSPDGKQVVSGSHDKTVRLWDVATGAVLQTLEGHSDSLILVAFSPDGKQVMSKAYDRTVRLWDAATGAMLQTLEGHTGWVTSVAFSPDGKLVDTLSWSNNWIVEGKTKLLWLPPDYRATSEAIWNRKIVLGHSSGRMSFFEFHEGSKLISE